MARSFKVYTGLMAIVALATLSIINWASLAELSTGALLGLLALIVLGLISEQLAFTFKVGKNTPSASLIFILFFASVLLFGPVATIVLALVTGVMSQLIHRKPVYRAVFNSSQFIVVTALAGYVYQILGGRSSTDEFVFSVIPFIGFGLTMSVANLLAASVGLSLIESMSLRKVITRVFGRWGANLAYDLLVSPVALLVAVLFIEFSIPGLVLATFTLFFVRRSYLTNYQLQEANRDLLKALVKAIETRDPYTSGHSVRVSNLARAIAEQLGLTSRIVEEVETAALLHDIGKIDEIYVDILRKEGDLSIEERRIIESHTVRGEELLRSLSSFPEAVVAAVKHHHERIDGFGYPSRIRGDEIPLGARIIKVCDAIDAMLSDRPYRKALALPEVREQLRHYAGTQFDQTVVDAVIEGPFLEEHATELLRQKEQLRAATTEGLWVAQAASRKRMPA